MSDFKDKTVVPQNVAEKIFHLNYFMYLVLKMDKTDCIGIEVKDDCNVDFSKGTILSQLKHSISTTAKGNAINLTDKDDDLWKTIKTWIEYVENSKTKIEELEFELVTNKTVVDNNILKWITEFQNSKLEFEDFTKKINALINPVKNPEVDSYIKKILDLDRDKCMSFLGRIKMQNISNDEIIKLSKERISEIYIGAEAALIECIFENVYSNLHRIIYTKAKGKKIEIRYNELEDLLKKAFRKYTSIKVYQTEPSDFNIPDEVLDSLAEQTFIKQMIDIDYIDGDDEVIDYTKSKFAASRSMERWVMNEGALDAKEKFNSEIMSHFEITFKEVYSRRRIRELNTLTEDKKEEAHIDSATDCLNKVKSKNILFDKQPLDIKISNGHFYVLSDIPSIGWRLDWKELYKPNKS
ncbi:MAG: hypothetical protein MUF42_12100 [Cytophagaceae bacterium]|jgi:hypothetical protein|nr:hypothetical protein [Cytophagaceae bacterium]